MSKNNAFKKITLSMSKIANLGDLLLGEDGHPWELDELHLTPKGGDSNEKIICKYVLENGKWVLKCVKP